MDIKTIWAKYDAYAKSASDSARILSLAGLAIVWMFRFESAGLTHIDRMLFVGAIAFVAALCADFLQYVLGTLMFLFVGILRQDAKQTDERKVSAWALRPMDVCFFIKLFAVATGYVGILMFMFSRVG